MRFLLLMGQHLGLLWAAPLNSEEQLEGAHIPGRLQGVLKEQQLQKFQGATSWEALQRHFWKTFDVRA